MTELAKFPYYEFVVDKAGKVVDAAARAQLVSAIAQGNDITDVFVISHGWNNDIEEAKQLYKEFFETLRTALDSGKYGLSQHRFAVVGVFWPSKKFADAGLIAGGAAAVSDPQKVLSDQLDILENAFDHPDAPHKIRQAKALLLKLDNDTGAQEEFADLIRQLPNTKKPDPEDLPKAFFTLSGKDIMDRFATPIQTLPKSGSDGGAANIGSVGRAAGLGGIFGGVGNAALNLLNYTTYYQMKERAGLIGRGAVADLLNDLRSRRLHLIGHSFGARLVTSAALGPDGRKPPPIATMTLLQGAFSHNGFAENYDGKKHDGFFRSVISGKRISGPLLITHSVQDKAVGTAYPLASRLAGQNAAALGDANDPYGGLGRNGAQHTPGAVPLKLTPAIDAASLSAGSLYNLNGDVLITGHSDISKKPEIANALLWAVGKT